jgi:flagellar assembly protein FliH
MSAATKFLFDVDFTAADGKPERLTITLAEHALKLAEAETLARRGGYEDARTDAGIEAERRTALALEAIAASLAEASTTLKAIEARLECEAVDVAVAVARKLAPALVAGEPFAEISALASSCFRELIAAPHVAVRVNDELYAAIREKLEAIARGRGFEGRLVVLAEAEVAPGDCRIEWADGGINRDSAAADAAIGEAVARYVSARRGVVSASNAQEVSR